MHLWQVPGIFQTAQFFGFREEEGSPLLLRFTVLQKTYPSSEFFTVRDAGFERGTV